MPELPAVSQASATYCPGFPLCSRGSQDLWVHHSTSGSQRRLLGGAWEGCGVGRSQAVAAWPASCAAGRAAGPWLRGAPVRCGPRGLALQDPDHCSQAIGLRASSSGAATKAGVPGVWKLLTGAPRLCSQAGWREEVREASVSSPASAENRSQTREPADPAGCGSSRTQRLRGGRDLAVSLSLLRRPGVEGYGECSRACCPSLLCCPVPVSLADIGLTDF